ncbi:hypothetical protein GGR57DRAFT_500525 [Xylariaceae sp. FL1272]|nr:hypothetical protein GGR57DRAFT_500525 [Xylariaceae sp. FL1272]
MPSGSEEANRKYQEGVEKTRKAADQPVTKDDARLNADNPKTGYYVSKLAKGDTDASHYDPGHYPGSGKG